MSVFVIAEAGVNHNGRLDLALELVDRAAEAGADAVKFQTFKTELNVAKNAPLAPYQERAGIEENDQFQMIKNLELSANDFKKIVARCEQKGIEFISTPDDSWSIQLLVDLGVKTIKIASAEVDNLPLLKEIAAAGKKVILSTGMSYLEEVKRALTALRSAGAKDITLLHCTSNYPTSMKDVNLRAMKTLAALGVDVGYSDHTLGSETAIAAVALGATVLEKHFTLDRNLPGPDHQASLTVEELKDYVDAIRRTEVLLGKEKKEPCEAEQAMRPAMRRSMFAARPIRSGQALKAEDLIFKRPGTGISPASLEKIIGKKTSVDLDQDAMLSWDHLEK